MIKVDNCTVVNKSLDGHVTDDKLSFIEAVEWCFNNKDEECRWESANCSIKVNNGCLLTRHGGAEWAICTVTSERYGVRWSIVKKWTSCYAYQALAFHDEGKKTHCRSLDGDWIDGIKTVTMEDAHKFEWEYQV